MNEAAVKYKGSDLANEGLVGMRPVDVGGVEEGDAGGDCVADEFDHVGLRLRGAIEGRHAHAPKPLCRYFQPF